MHNRYDKLKLDYAKSALELKDLYDNTRNDKTEDSALWYMGEALGALCVYYVSCTNTSPSSENTALNNMGPRYNYEPSNECKSWDNLNFFTTTITILALQLSIEEWIIQEIGSSNKANPHFIDHYQLVLNMINSGEEKKNAKVFFEALTLLRNKSSHRHSNATINEKEENKIKDGGFSNINLLNKRRQLDLTPTKCLDIIKISMSKISEIRLFLRKKVCS